MNESCEHLRRRGGWAEDRQLGRCTFPIGPLNTWSNIAYPLVGLIAAIATGGGIAAWVFFISMTILGLGSGLYHGFKTIWANQLDWFGMYSVFATLAVHALHPVNDVQAIWMVTAALAVPAMLVYVYKAVGADFLLGAGLVLASLPVWFSPYWGLGAGSLIVFGMGKYVWKQDKAKAPWIGIMGHAFWHILTAIAFGILFIGQHQNHINGT